MAYSFSLLLFNLGMIADTGFTEALTRHGIPVNVSSTLLFVTVLSVVRFICQFIVNFSSNVCQQFTLLKLRENIFRQIFFASATESIPPSRVQFLLASVTPRVASFMFGVVTLASSGLQLLALFIIMMKGSWALTLLAMGLMGVAGLLVMQISRKVRTLSSHLPPLEAKLYSHLQNSLRNWVFLKIMRLESAENKELNRLAQAQYDRFSDYAVYKNINYGLASLLGALTVVGLVFFGHQYWHIPGEVLVSFLYLNFRFVGTASTAVNTWDAMSVDASYVDIAQAEIHNAPADTRSLPDGHAVSVKDTLRNAPSISAKNVTYRYVGSSSNTLQDLDFEVGAGGQVGIIGPSGSGKSTLLSIILGIIPANKGTISIDGLSASEFLERYSAAIGYVGPDPFIIGGSIRSNLLYANHATNVSDEDIWDALEKSSLDKFVKDLPSGLEYHLTEMGEGLSVGQKQRLALARAMLRKPKLLILDECTANLDDKTELDLANSLKELRGKVTMVIVSHKKGILSYADQILDISKV